VLRIHDRFYFFQFAFNECLERTFNCFNESICKASATEMPNELQPSDNKSSRAIFHVFLAGIPSKTKGVLISLRGQQIPLRPQTNNKLKSSTELDGVVF
jgi:hypothetical protein